MPHPPEILTLTLAIARGAALRRVFWRVHFWAGLITAPLVLFAALTGLLYVFTPQIEAWRHAELDRVPASASMLPLDQQVAAVQAAFPGQPLRYVVPAARPGQTTQVALKRADAGHAGHAGHTAGAEQGHGLPDGDIAYVDPATARVVGRLAEMERFGTWAKKLHSSALQGDGWRWLLELAASWMLVMFATGLVLWWPRSQAQGGPGWRALLPRWGRGRQTWRDAHALVAIVMGGVLAVVLVTGLTWSRHAGDNFRLLQRALQQESPRPAAGLASGAPQGRAPLGWQAAYDSARRVAPSGRLQLTPPADASGTWRIDNAERRQPGERVSLRLDAYSGEPLFRSGWDDLPLLAKATTVGIPFHRAEFGLWNQVLLAAAALAAIFSVVSGLAMWWWRRPAGKVAAPAVALRQVRAVPWWLWALALLLGWAMPAFGLSALLLAAAEGLTALWRRGRSQRAGPLAG